MGQSSVQTVPACPVQIRDHHYIDVYTDINKVIKTHLCVIITVLKKHILMKKALKHFSRKKKTPL